MIPYGPRLSNQQTIQPTNDGRVAYSRQGMPVPSQQDSTDEEEDDEADDNEDESDDSGDEDEDSEHELPDQMSKSTI